MYRVASKVPVREQVAQGKKDNFRSIWARLNVRKLRSQYSIRLIVGLYRGIPQRRQAHRGGMFYAPPTRNRVLELLPHVRCRLQQSGGWSSRPLGVTALRSVARQHAWAPVARSTHELNPSFSRLWPDSEPRAHHNGLCPLQRGRDLRSRVCPPGRSRWGFPIRGRAKGTDSTPSRRDHFDQRRPTSRLERQISFWEGPKV